MEWRCSNPRIRSTGKIPAGLILVKPGTETYSRLIDSIAKHLQDEEKAIVINLTSSQAPNVKSVLKSINQNAINQHATIGDEDIVTDRQKVKVNVLRESGLY